MRHDGGGIPGVSFAVGRVRAPEWLVGVASLALALDLFLMSWYGAGDGWRTLTLLRFLVAVCALGGVAVLWLQGAFRAPAPAVCATSIELVISLLTLAGLIVRVLLAPPAAAGATRAGAYAALALCAAIALFAYRSLRLDGIRDVDCTSGLTELTLPEAD